MPNSVLLLKTTLCNFLSREASQKYWLFRFGNYVNCYQTVISNADIKILMLSLFQDYSLLLTVYQLTRL